MTKFYMTNHSYKINGVNQWADSIKKIEEILGMKITFDTEGRIDLSNKDFSKIDIKLEDCFLRGINFSKTAFGELFMKNCNLEDSIFYDSYSSCANFIKCKLKGSNFSDAFMSSTRFKSCDISKCDFSYATLESVDFFRSSLYASNFEAAMLMGSRLENAGIIDCNFAGAGLSNTCLEGVTI